MGSETSNKEHVAEHQVIFTVKSNGVLNITFEPGLAGEKALEKLTDEEKLVQGFAADVAGRVMEVLKCD